MFRVLITGIAGFIGSNLAQKCIEKGMLVDGIDDMSNGRTQFIPNNMNFFYYKDFAAPEMLSTMKTHKYDVVFHLAAQPRVSYSVEYPVETFNTNVEKTVRLIDACNGNVKRFIFASSSAVYGDSKKIPTVEDSIRSYRSPYAMHKGVIEDVLSVNHQLSDMDCASFRFFNVYGKNQLGGSPYSTAVSSWLTAIKKDQSMRSDGDGTQTRDMVHVDDVVQALMKAANHPEKLQGDVFNVGSGMSVSNTEILQYLLKRYDSSRCHDAPARQGDVQHTLADIQKIREKLGYEPQVEFWNGLEMTCEWYDKNWDWIKKLV